MGDLTRSHNSHGGTKWDAVEVPMNPTVGTYGVR
jgi:hypothetical protein